MRILGGSIAVRGPARHAGFLGSVPDLRITLLLLRANYPGDDPRSHFCIPPDEMRGFPSTAERPL